jgi:hypothetical protein
VTQYFFSRASASWVGPLASVGFFDAPPATVVDEESGRVQFPSWPESEYLVRAAANLDSRHGLDWPDAGNAQVSKVRSRLGKPRSSRFARSILNNPVQQKPDMNLQTQARVKLITWGSRD